MDLFTKEPAIFGQTLVRAILFGAGDFQGAGEAGRMKFVGSRGRFSGKRAIRSSEGIIPGQMRPNLLCILSGRGGAAVNRYLLQAGNGRKRLKLMRRRGRKRSSNAGRCFGSSGKENDAATRGCSVVSKRRVFCEKASVFAPVSDYFLSALVIRFSLMRAFLPVRSRR